MIHLQSRSDEKTALVVNVAQNADQPRVIDFAVLALDCLARVQLVQNVIDLGQGQLGVGFLLRLAERRGHVHRGLDGYGQYECGRGCAGGLGVSPRSLGQDQLVQRHVGHRRAKAFVFLNTGPDQFKEGGSIRPCAESEASDSKNEIRGLQCQN